MHPEPADVCLLPEIKNTKKGNEEENEFAQKPEVGA